MPANTETSGTAVPRLRWENVPSNRRWWQRGYSGQAIVAAVNDVGTSWSWRVQCRDTPTGTASTEAEAKAAAESAWSEWLDLAGLVPADRAAIAAMHGWQPIETAPRDGTEIILGDHGGSYAGYWSTAECRRIPSCSEGNWFDECDRGNEVCARPSRPTHWMPMPLPNPPALSDPAPAPRDGDSHG